MDDDADLAALARCIGDVDAFAERYWGREPLVRRAAGPFDDLLDVEAIDLLLTSTVRRPSFRLVQDGTSLPPEEYTTTVRMGGAVVDDAVDVGRVGERVAAGATLVLQGLQRTWLPLARFCRALERATAHPVQANAYLTPPGVAGLGRHADTHDVIVLQVWGTKGWDVDGLGAFDLAASDVLYLPLGTRHAAAAQQAPSLHLTIGILRETYRQVLRRALDGLDRDLGLDDPLPIGHRRLAAELGERLAAATKALSDLDVDALAADEAGRVRRRRKPLLEGQLRSVLAAGDLTDATRVRRRDDNPAELADESDGRIALRLADRTLRMPVIARPALEKLLRATESAAVGELPGLDQGGRHVLVRRLIREGWLAVEP